MKRYKIIKSGTRIVIQRWSIKLQMWVIETSYRNEQIDNISDIHIDNDDEISITWCLDDFEQQAIVFEEREQTEKELAEKPILYNREKFSEALSDMKRHHDANFGISWDTVDYYLNEHCLIQKDEEDIFSVLDESANYEDEEDENV